MPSASKPQASSPKSDKPPRRAWHWVLIVLTVLNALAVLTLFVLICFVSEKWWVSAAISFLPRLPFAFPSVVLLGVTAFTMRRWSIVNGLSAIVGLVFTAGLCAPVDRDPRPDDDERVIRFLTCNVLDLRLHPEKLLLEIARLDADVLVFQETPNGEQIKALYSGRQFVERGEYLIVSRYPVRQVGELRTPSAFFGNSGRLTATVFEVAHPKGAFQVVNVHCHTARWGLNALEYDSIVTGDGLEEFQRFQRMRETELTGLAQYCEMVADRMPTIFAGDFNTPATSSMFAELRADYRNAFESAGWGYGYTAPCNTANRWPSNTPWLRIDHILTSEEWLIHSAAIGHTNGSDHRLVWAELSLPEEK